jgi:archaellum component FlaF (FlaF/FlaG flagellin family)
MKNIAFSIILLSSIFGCKQTPTFVDDNPVDSDSPFYSVPAPHSPSLRFDVADSTYFLNWGLPTTKYSKTRVDRYDPKTDSFSPHFYVNNTVDSLAYQPDHQYITELVKIFNVFETANGDTLISPIQELTHRQSSIEFSALLNANRQVTLTWNHEILAENAKVVIVRRQDRTDQEIARLPVEDSTFTDPNPVDILTITEYKLYAVDDFYQTPTELITIGQDGVKPVDRVDLVNDDTNRLLLEIETDIESKSDSILVVLESTITGETFIKRQETHYTGINVVQFNEIEGELAPYNLNVYNRLYRVSSAPYSTILNSEVIFEKPIKTNLSTTINKDFLFIVNNGESLAYLNVSPEEPRVATPTLLSLETGTITHIFSGDTASSTLEYVESTNTLYANQPEGLLVMDLNTNDERIIERPSALLNSYLLHVDNNSIAYMYNTRYYVALFDLKSETQIGILETPEPRILLAADKQHLFAYTYGEEYYDVYRTSDHAILYSSSDKIDSLQILPDVFFGDDEMLLWSKYFGLYHLDLNNLEYQYISDNPAYGHNNFHGFYNAQNRKFYSISRQHNYNTMLSVWDVESKKIIQNLDITSHIPRGIANQTRLIYSYPTNTLYAFTNSAMFEFPITYEWSLDD